MKNKREAGLNLEQIMLFVGNDKSFVEVLVVCEVKVRLSSTILFNWFDVLLSDTDLSFC